MPQSKLKNKTKLSDRYRVRGCTVTAARVGWAGRRGVLRRERWVTRRRAPALGGPITLREVAEVSEPRTGLVATATGFLGFDMEAFTEVSHLRVRRAQAEGLSGEARPGSAREDAGSVP